MVLGSATDIAHVEWGRHMDDHRMLPVMNEEAQTDLVPRRYSRFVGLFMVALLLGSGIVACCV